MIIRLIIEHVNNFFHRQEEKVTDLELALLSRDAYLPNPEGKVIDWRDMRVVITGDVCSVRGTSSFDNAYRDMCVIGEESRLHPQLGECPSGPLDAAEALVPLIGHPQIITGHSLGGQTALLIAAILATNDAHPDLVVTFDAPKAGGDDLVELFVGVQTRQYKFRGSVVTKWPIAFYKHVRPLIVVGDMDFNIVQAHSIERACLWMTAHEGSWST